MVNSPVIEAQSVYKSFRIGEQDIEILKGINVKVGKGDFAIIFGPSGCGKSTLLHTMLGLEPPTKGKIFFEGVDLYEGGDDKRAEFRKTHIGMVYQQAYWIKSLSVIENVAFPLNLLGRDIAAALTRANEMLEMVGMADWASYVPTELSSGQQQKVSFARALTCNPGIIIADEPTGNLDSQSGKELMDLFKKFNQAGKTIVMVTHDLEYLPYASLGIRMKDGKIEEIIRGNKAALAWIGSAGAKKTGNNKSQP